MIDSDRRHVLTQLGAFGAAATGASAASLPAGTGGSPMDFGADPKGERDSTDALRRWMSQGGMLTIPAGSRFLVSDTLPLTESGTWIFGRGRLLAGRDLLGKPLLNVKGNDCIVDGLFIENPDRVQSAKGPKTYGVLVAGHRNQIRNCVVTDFEMGLATAPDGEFFDTLFAFNRCRVIGAGASGRGLGEDRGDGITDWGGRARIIGNVVEAAPGKGNVNDCRIGIHVEALTPYAKVTADPDCDAASEIIGNIVIPSPDGTGRFRRCYSAEGVRNTRIIGNYGRGWTWDGIWLVGSSDRSLVCNNILRQDRPVSGDSDGSEWSPDRAGILVYASNGVRLRDVRVSDNIVDLGRTANHGIMIRSGAADIAGVVIANNSCVAAESSDKSRCAGIIAMDVADVQLAGNRIKGAWRFGACLISVTDADLTDCTISDTAGFGISCQNNKGRLRICRNVVSNCAYGVESSGNAHALITDNHLWKVADMALSFAAKDNAMVLNNIVLAGNGSVRRFGDGIAATLRNNAGLDER